MKQTGQPKSDQKDRTPTHKITQPTQSTSDDKITISPCLTESGVQYYDSRNVTDEEILRQLVRGNIPVMFDWENKWLRGDQYAHMLNNIDAYQAAFGMQKMREKQHPENIYV